MTTALEQRAASRVAPIGLLFLVTASVGWGLNWPVMKFVFSEWPPLSARGWAGVIGAAALALYAVATGVSLKVPADQWPRLIISASLNVALWVAVMSYALLWRGRGFRNYVCQIHRISWVLSPTSSPSAAQKLPRCIRFRSASRPLRAATGNKFFPIPFSAASTAEILQ